MIDARELRVGSWVNYTSDISGQTSPIQIDWTWFGNEADQNCSSSIPLTPEILEKAGFKFIDDHHSFYGWYLELTKRHSLSWCHGGTVDIEDNEYLTTLEVPIAFLHQLQNLYKSLTNKELNITL